MIVDNISEVNDALVVDLNLHFHVHLDTGSVHGAEITDIVLAILADNHELRVPQFLVVRDLVVIGLAFSDLENALASID